MSTVSSAAGSRALRHQPTKPDDPTEHEVLASGQPGPSLTWTFTATLLRQSSASPRCRNAARQPSGTLSAMTWSIEVVSVITTGAVAILSTLVPAVLRGWDHREERTMLRLTKDMESRAALWDQRSRIYADVLDFVWKHYRVGERGALTHLMGGSYPEEERPALAALSARLDVYGSPPVSRLPRRAPSRACTVFTDSPCRIRREA